MGNLCGQRNDALQKHLWPSTWGSFNTWCALNEVLQSWTKVKGQSQRRRGGRGTRAAAEETDVHSSPLRTGSTLHHQHCNWSTCYQRSKQFFNSFIPICWPLRWGSFTAAPDLVYSSDKACPCPYRLLCNPVFHSPILWAALGCRREQDLGVFITSGWKGSLSAWGLPVEDSQVDGVDLALESPESFSSRLWIFNMHQVFNSSTKDIWKAPTKYSGEFNPWLMNKASRTDF